MAFTLQVVRGSTTYDLTSPFLLEGADGIGGAPVRNIEDSGPFQDGATHLGERLDPRTITLSINIVGASASALDGHRDTLNTMFKPITSVPIQLKLTRDDGAVRQIDCRRVGPMDIPLVALNRPGNLHRAVVQLRAVEPLWYNPTQQSLSYPSLAADWWTGYATIGTANVLTHPTSVGTATDWAFSGTVVANGPWSVAARTSRPSGGTQFMWDNGALNLAYIKSSTDTSGVFNFQTSDTALSFPTGTVLYVGIAAASAGTVYGDNVQLAVNNAGAVRELNTGGRWRSDVLDANTWSAAMSHAAVYNVALTSTQRANLGSAIVDNIAGTSITRAIVYAGDYDEYPVITITGYYANPVITNSTTGDTLNFTGGTVGSADTWTIDTRYGHKTVVNAAGSSVLNYLTSASDLSTFRFVPSPTASGGTNTLTISGSVSGSAAVAITYYARYFSF
jgi:hypothetical protein